MVTLEKIQPQLFPKLYESFLADDDPLSEEQDWRNVFDYQWEKEEDYCGYALLDDGIVVGMIGMIFCERHIDGKTRKLCNLHTWWVREDHRGRSLALLRPLLKLNDYTITHFTPCDIVRAISKRLGFEEISVQLKILPPHLSLRGSGAPDEPLLIYDPQVIEATLAEHDRKIFLDHQPYRSGHLLIAGGGSYCYILFTRVVRHWMPYCHIHYISNRELFEQNERFIRASLLSACDARFVALDARLVKDMSIAFSFDLWSPGQGLYKSSDLKPDQIDNLYSDIVFLKLTVLPDTSYELQRLFGKVWPFGR